MWKKDEAPAQTPTAARPEPTPRPERHTPAPAPAASERASIGRSITIKGEVTGDEDLVIQGRVDGSVDLKQHAVTIGPDGEVKASITARIVTVEGRVEGDLSADEQVILRSSASVHGDITAPRVVLEDGARFRGGVDMGEPAKRSNNASAQDARKAERGNKPTPEPIDSARTPKSVSQSPAEVKS